MENIQAWVAIITGIISALAGLVTGLFKYWSAKKKMKADREKNKTERMKMEKERQALLEQMPQDIKDINSSVKEIRTNQQNIQQQLNEVEVQSLRHIIMSAGHPDEMDVDELAVVHEACQRYISLGLNHETRVRCDCITEAYDEKIKNKLEDKEE